MKFTCTQCGNEFKTIYKTSGLYLVTHLQCDKCNISYETCTISSPDLIEKYKKDKANGVKAD